MKSKWETAQPGFKHGGDEVEQLIRELLLLRLERNGAMCDPKGDVMYIDMLIRIVPWELESYMCNFFSKFEVY